MKNLKLLALLVGVIFFTTTQKAVACSCSGAPLFFWDIVSKTTKNAMVKFENLEPSSNNSEYVGKFTILENYNIPAKTINDTIILKSYSAGMCNISIEQFQKNDSFLIALEYGNQLTSFCYRNFAKIAYGRADFYSLPEAREKLRTLTSSSKDVNESAGIFTFPNPATTNLTVTIPFNGSKEVKVEILNLNGRILRTLNTKNPEETLQVESLPKGLYLVRLLYQHRKPIVRKWVKARCLAIDQ